SAQEELWWEEIRGRIPSGDQLPQHDESLLLRHQRGKEKMRLNQKVPRSVARCDAESQKGPGILLASWRSNSKQEVRDYADGFPARRACAQLYPGEIPGMP